MKKKIGAFGAGQFSLGTLVEGRPGTTIFQNPGGGGGWGGVTYKDPARLPPPGDGHGGSGGGSRQGSRWSHGLEFHCRKRHEVPTFPGYVRAPEPWNPRAPGVELGAVCERQMPALQRAVPLRSCALVGRLTSASLPCEL